MMMTIRMRKPGFCIKVKFHEFIHMNPLLSLSSRFIEEHLDVGFRNLLTFFTFQYKKYNLSKMHKTFLLIFHTFLIIFCMIFCCCRFLDIDIVVPSFCMESHMESIEGSSVCPDYMLFSRCKVVFGFCELLCLRGVFFWKAILLGNCQLTSLPSKVIVDPWKLFSLFHISWEL